MNREHCANAAGRKQRKCAKKRFSLLYSIPILIFTFLGAPEIVLAGDFTGLWVGQIEILQINEVGHPTDTVTPTDVAHPFDMRILLHSEDTDLDDETNAETVRLLKRVTVMGRRYEVEVEDGVYEERIERVLVTDDSILGDYEGVSRRDGKLVGLRLGSAAFEFDDDPSASEAETLELAGNIGLGQTLVGESTLDEDHPLNPFKHKYHPDHRSGFDVTRMIALTFDSAKDPEDADSGVNTFAGDYEEVIVGIHKMEIRARGRFIINRVSMVPTLNDH